VERVEKDSRGCGVSRTLQFMKPFAGS